MSGIRFQCPNCNSQRTANARMAGRSIRCPDCDSVITIPELAEPVPVVNVVQAMAPAVSPVFAAAGQLVPSEPLTRTSSSAATSSPAMERQESDPPTPTSEAEEEIEDVSLGERPPMDEEMDMTPMVDVTFLLLIFFMVTASFASEKVIQQRTPKKDAASASRPEVVEILTIRIDDLNTFLVMLPDQSEVDASNKQDLIIALDNARKEGLLDDVENVKIDAHESSIHAALIAALDACRSEGLANFQVKVVEDFD